MAKEPELLSDFMADYEKELEAKAAAVEAHYNSPEEVAKRKARQQREFDLGVREGWWNENGEPLGQGADEEDMDDSYLGDDDE